MFIVDPYVNDAEKPTDVAEWTPDASYRCHIAIIPEDDGDFSVVVLNLPGAGSCGDTEGGAVENCKEAVRAVIASYQESGEAIPWVSDYDSDSDIPADAKCKWILVNA